MDVLTGLAPAAELEALTAASWQAATAAAGALSLLLVALDDFPRYCASYGQRAGEVLLRRTGAIVRASLALHAEPVARLAGGEFLIILPGARLAAAQAPARRILQAVRARQVANRRATVGNFVTVSIGAASCRPQPGDSMVTLIDAVTAALWTAKQHGHNRIAAYELSPDSEIVPADSDIKVVG